MLKLFKVSDFRANSFELCLQQVSHFKAGTYMVFPQFQELSDFSQGETQALHLPDKVQPSHITICIEPEPACCARSLGKQRAALIEANGIHGECRQLRHFSDLHADCAIRNLGHIDKDTLWSMVQSQGFP